ncbi:MAG TPA: FCD domain-containing protein [Candidatus Blautia merdavium]|uniref:FCD domain-containing protein n=1 Tax=Candidatus Blautia merdavium TaxID=2838494 RepID=A0A9D2PKD9_9FIRM|nr:FCD domain-containing protein [Candidatus Blautia merdavium]
MTERKQKTKEEHEKVYFTVIDYIKQLAMEGKIAFGGKIPSERELMNTLGLSRNSIREALRSMENMGLIESRQGQGNFLVNHMGESLNRVFSMLLFMGESDYVEISQLRRFIEIGAYLLAVRKAKEEDLDRLDGIWRGINQCSEEEKVKRDKEFHDEIIRISGNRLLSILNESLGDLFKTLIADLAMNIASNDWDELCRCHEKVSRCLRDRDIQGGMKAIREHYNIIDRDLEAYTKKAGNSEKAAKDREGAEGETENL